MYISIYVCVYVYIYAFIYTHMCTCINIYVYQRMTGLYYVASVVLAPAELPSVEVVISEDESVEEAGAFLWGFPVSTRRTLIILLT